MHVQRRRIVAAVVAIGAAVGGVSLLAPTSGAVPPYDPDTHETSVTLPDPDTTTTNPLPPSGCSDYTWFSTPKLVIHDGEFEAGSGDILDVTRMHMAIDAVLDQFNLMGATSAAVSPLQFSDEPFEFQSWYFDATPTIHVGFTTDIGSLADSAGAAGVENHRRMSNCSIAEAHIAFPDLEHRSWNFNSPYGTVDEKYYDTTPSDASFATWFRPLFLHELLHAFDLQHSSDTYAFMNYPSYDGFPWPNLPAPEAIKPLPADVRALRELYPEAGSRTEVAVLNTWFDGSAESLANGAAAQTRLCQPSLGDDWGDRLSPGTCGTDGANDAQGSKEICDGDTLRTRFALANYSTDEVDVLAQLWFSYDEEFQAVDFDSASSYVFSVPAAHSQLKAYTFEVPNIVEVPGSEYHAILRVVSTTDPDGDGMPQANTVREDWIPLRGTLEIC